MKRKNLFFLLIFLITVFSQRGIAGDTSRYLILNFDCQGLGKGASEAIGNALRSQIQKSGGQLVSRDLFTKILKQKGIDESDLNYTIDELSALLPSLDADGAVYGHVFKSEDLFMMELRYIGLRSSRQILFDPVVCGSVDDIYEVMPELAAMILSPDKSPPHVVTVDPGNGQDSVGQYVDLKIKFSEPMNPSTISVSGVPEKMWTRYGDVKYDNKSNTFLIKLHLYPDIEYRFQINGDLSKGFKDLAGNPAEKYSWSFRTAP